MSPSHLGVHSNKVQPSLHYPDVEVLVLTAPADVEVGEAVDGPELTGSDGGHPACVLRHEQLVLEPVHGLGCKQIIFLHDTHTLNLPRWSTP